MIYENDLAVGDYIEEFDKITNKWKIFQIEKIITKTKNDFIIKDSFLDKVDFYKALILKNKNEIKIICYQNKVVFTDQEEKEQKIKIIKN